MWPADWSRVKAPASLAHVTGIVTNAGASFQCGVNKFSVQLCFSQLSRIPCEPVRVHVWVMVVG